MQDVLFPTICNRQYSSLKAIHSSQDAILTSKNWVPKSGASRPKVEMKITKLFKSPSKMKKVRSLRNLVTLEVEYSTNWDRMRNL